MPVTFVDNANVMPKRQILVVLNDDWVTFIVEGNTVRIVNFAIYAMQMLQNDMCGAATEADILSEDDLTIQFQTDNLYFACITIINKIYIQS